MIKYNRSNCTGCRICEIACSMYHHNVINTKLSAIRYEDDWPKIGTVNFCRQCKNKKCIKACPTGALKVNNNNLVEIQNAICNGCLKCAEACPFGNLPIYKGKPIFCDTCSGQYSCVKWCPNKALERIGD